MPIFEYKCVACSHREEKLIMGSAKEPTTCPECGREMVKLVSAGGFILKGTGWYRGGASAGKK